MTHPTTKQSTEITIQQISSFIRFDKHLRAGLVCPEDPFPCGYRDFAGIHNLEPNPITKFTTVVDVAAKGKSDVVVASKRFVNGVQQLYLAVYEANDNGIISTNPTTTFTGIVYPTQLIPLDFNGDGRNDFLHIIKSLHSHILTVSLSTPDGFQTQPSMTFKPEYIDGNFYVGDFEGTGHVGLVYIYQPLKSGSPQIRFIPFTSDASKFAALSPVDGPPGIAADKVKVVVGDLTSDNAEDVFLIDWPLANVAQSIPYLDTRSFLPYGAEDTGKTSPLVASRNLSGNLRFQMLRSSGSTLLAPTAANTTDIAFSGNITLARTTSVMSPSSVDVVNTFSTLNNDTRVDVLRFFADSFVLVASVTQPGVSSPLVSWADLQGLGRVDCVLATQISSRTLSISTLPCSTLQPIDYVSGYENGLGAKVVATNPSYLCDIEKTLPAPSSDTQAMVVTYTYAFESKTTRVTETRSYQGGSQAVSKQSIKAILNPSPSPSNFIQNLMIESQDENDLSVRTTYDALARPVSISDAADVQSSLAWDGLGRVTNRRITQPVSGSPQVINDNTLIFQDDAGLTTTTNNLTGATSKTTCDWNGQVVKKVTPEETFTFGYDEGGGYGKEHLVSVTSSNNVTHRYEYKSSLGT
ncbi:hypothetical protein ONZ45_g5905 [Pleurotus djamor]|nr:hypothetical protein ONZ45_g5905 [Pleurotus djamor]